MTDDAWRRGRREEGDDDFGPPLFADDPTGTISTDLPTSEVHAVDLSFGPNDTGPLPHWTEPPTGELPRVLSSGNGGDHTEDLDVWSTFSGKQPVWRDDPVEDPSGAIDDFRDMGEGVAGDDGLAPDPFFDATAPGNDTGRIEVPPRREPGRITIGTDPTDDGSRPIPRRGRPGEPPPRGKSPARSGGRPVQGGRPATAGARPAGGTAGRDMPVAIAVGIALAAAFILAIMISPVVVLVVICVVLTLAAVEFFDKVTEKGYRPANIAGILACLGAPLAAYMIDLRALPLVVVFAFAAGCATFIGAASVDSSPMPNMAITTLGVVWIGLLGSYGVLILNMSNIGAVVAKGFISKQIGTDTLCLLAIGVVANDVGALAVGSVAGRTPLRAWISPNKSVEGFIGGAVVTLLAMFVIGLMERSNTWNSTGDLLLLGVVIAIFAPLGDLTESMFKRNLDVKDFGSIVKGHGGVLDRFDGFLFTLPATYYLLTVLHPWVTK